MHSNNPPRTKKRKGKHMIFVIMATTYNIKMQKLKL